MGATALQSYTETDPVWVAVSNTVTAGAALGATALQSYTETDPVWVAAEPAISASAALADTATQPGDALTTLNATAWRLFYSDGSGDVSELALGADGDVLTTAGAASVPTWETPSAGGNPVSTNDVCIVQFNANDTYTLNGHRTLEFDTIVHDSGNNFDTGTYAYTVPTSRMYFVAFYTRGAGSSSRRAFYIRLNGTAKVITDYDAIYVDTYSMYSATALFYAEAGDTIDASVYPYTTDFAALGNGIRSKLMIIPIGE